MNCKEKLKFPPNIGWMYNGNANNGTHTTHPAKFLDKNIVNLCKGYGGVGFTFLVYPVGGLRRFLWKPKTNGDCPPPIHLPDQQMNNELWSKYIMCRLSDWIDPDSADSLVADLSMDHFCQELEYVRYLGVHNVMIVLKHFSSPRLATLINDHRQFGLEFVLPTKIADLTTSDNGKDVWTIWRDFRTACGNFARMSVALLLTADLDPEFDLHNEMSLRRWYAEPLLSLILDQSLFVSDMHTSSPTLPNSHSLLIKHLMANCRQSIILSSSIVQSEDSSSLVLSEDLSILKQMVHVAKQLILSNETICQSENSMAGFLDLLQTPLQPLSDNLDSAVYQTFEQDLVKYEHYQMATKAALLELSQQKQENGEVVVFVLGAGRGPLVQAVINARNELEMMEEQSEREQCCLNWKLKLVAVEKNRNAILSLNYCNEERWSNFVQIVHSDMRSLSDFVASNVLKRPDLIISELLGSFGDNELCPECLDGVLPILKPDTICIPQSYTNFITPIQSLHLHQSVASLNKCKSDEHSVGRSKKTFGSAFDRSYVVCMDQFCYLAENVEPCFRFDHPNKWGTPNSRQSRVQFELIPNCELMGFSGHFEANLFKDIYLSTHPLRSTENMHSWFPALFPLRHLYHFREVTTVTFNIQRKVDNDGCWYEWSIEYEASDGRRVRSEVQNEKGESQYMKLR